jgi:hypothetical protein
MTFLAARSHSSVIMAFYLGNVFMTRSFILASLLFTASSAFDFGSLMQSLAPVATPVVDSVAASDPLILRYIQTGSTPGMAQLVQAALVP